MKQLIVLKHSIRAYTPDLVISILMHMRRHKAMPRIFRPRTFNEKCLHRKLFDRRPLLTRYADKYAVRSYVQEILGENLLPELYYVTQDPSSIPFDTLPDKFVIKPTHGSGWVQIIKDKSTCNTKELLAECRDWLAQNFYQMTREWVYKDIPPRIMIEEFIDDGSGNAPNDYKLHVFGGKVASIQVDAGRFEHHKRSYYSTTWEKLPFTCEYDGMEGLLPMPHHLEGMIEAAEALASGMDYLRIDFYDTPSKLYFGEITTIPGGGLDRFRPISYDEHYGRLWNQISANPHNAVPASAYKMAYPTVFFS